MVPGNRSVGLHPPPGDPRSGYDEHLYLGPHHRDFGHRQRHPTNGVNLYATVSSKINGSWEPNYFTYTEAGTPAPAALTSPAPGTILPGSSVTFTWSTGSGPTAYLLYLGTTAVGSSNLYASPSTTTATSVTVTGIPTSGATVHATLYSKINGAWQNAKYTFTEAAPATLIGRTPGSVLSGSSVTFTWTGSSPSTGYLLYLGTIQQGSANIYDSGVTTAYVRRRMT